MGLECRGRDPEKLSRIGRAEGAWRNTFKPGNNPHPMSILGLEFTVTKEVSNEIRERVWGIMSNVEEMPKYWRGHREVNVVNRNGNEYLVKVRFAFPGPMNRGFARITVDHQGRQVVINYVEGPIRGYVVNKLEGNTVVSQWRVSITPLFLPMKTWIRNHFIKGATNALTRIIQQAGGEA